MWQTVAFGIALCYDTYMGVLFMNTVLYEASFKIGMSDWIPILMLIVLAFFPKLLEISREYYSADVYVENGKKFCRVAFVVVAVFSVIIGITKVNMYSRTVAAYKKGEYMVVEGYVENFVPMPYEGKADESFEINGVKFFYSDYEVQYGYNTSKSHGGVITGDGQHLKIGYVYYNKGYGNIIVYIEELP